MSARTWSFRCTANGETRDFTQDDYDASTTRHSAEPEQATGHSYQDADGFRLQRMLGGSFEDKWGIIWVQEQSPLTLS